MSPDVGSPDALLILSAAGTIELLDAGAERLFGCRAAEAVGRQVSDLLISAPEGSPAETRGPDIAVQVPADGLAVARRPDGSTVPVRVHVATLEPPPEGRRAWAVRVTRLEPGGRAALMHAGDAQWQAIFRSAVDAVVVMDAEGLIEAFNPAAERLFGWSEDETVGTSVTRLMPSPYREEHQGYVSRYLVTGEPRIIGIGREVTAMRRDGTTFPVHLSVGEATAGGVRRFVGILHDLSDRVRMETRLREHEALAKLGEMSAVIAHEVRNPLAGMRGALQMLLRHVSADADRAIVNEIIARLDSLDGLVKDLLQFARRPQPRLAPVDISRLVRMTAHLLEMDPAMRDVTIDVAGHGPVVRADASMLGVVLHNVLVNAAQATGPGGRIAVSLADLAGSCRLTIADSGAGVSPADRARLFTPFFTTKVRGTGLGLATAQRFVDAHGGRIAANFPLEGGTEIVIDLPADPPESK